MERIKQKIKHLDAILNLYEYIKNLKYKEAPNLYNGKYDVIFNIMDDYKYGGIYIIIKRFDYKGSILFHSFLHRELLEDIKVIEHLLSSFNVSE